MNEADSRLSGLIDQHFRDSPDLSPARLGVAVSGGGDSLALLLLLRDWAAVEDCELFAVTVDHGLRDEAASEAAGVAALCARLGVAHLTLDWRWDGAGNLPDRARRGRLSVIADWAAEQGIADVALGHTADDQAETFLMRLARGSGVDGLSCMAPRRRAEGLIWHRPLLAARRSELRAFLAALGEDWIEDPTNDDAGFDRVKARRALAGLEPLGLTVETLNETAGRMRLARSVLERVAHDLARDAARVVAGDVEIHLDALKTADEETRLRILSAAIRWISGADYRPRWQGTLAAWEAIEAGRSHTLAGCLMTPGRDHLRVAREYQAVRDLATPADMLWDGRWRLDGPSTAGLSVRATGEAGLAQCPDWRAGGLPRSSLLAAPSVWDGDVLIAAPLAGLSQGWTARLAAERADFADVLITH